MFPAVLSVFAGVVLADAPQVVDVKTTQSGGAWRFDVSILHPE